MEPELKKPEETKATDFSFADEASLMEQPEQPIVKKKIIGISPVLNDKGEATSYKVKYSDGSTGELAPNDPSLEQQLPASKFFIREKVGEKGELGETAVFELSRIGHEHGSDNRILIEVNQLLPNGEPDPRYEKIMEALERQTLDFVTLKLAYNPSTGKHRVLDVGQVPEYSFAAYYNKDAKSWVKTDSSELREFTYTEKLKDACDIHGQWRIHEENISTISKLADPIQYGTFKKTYSHAALAELDRITEKRAKKEGLDKHELVAYMQEQRSKFNRFLQEDWPQTNTLGSMLTGQELTYVDGKQSIRQVIYDLDLDLTDQIETPTGVSADEATASEFTQILNYAFQSSLREKMIQDNKLSQVFTEANNALVREEILPFADPYRKPQDNQLLNQEFTEMVGANLIAATMKHLGAEPRTEMESLGEDGAATHMLEGIYTGLDPKKIHELSLTDLLARADQEAKATIHAHLVEVERLVEEEAFEPGKSPRAKKRKALQDAQEKLQGMSTLAATSAASGVGAVHELETVGILH